MKTLTIINLAKKVLSGCDRTPQLKAQVKKADFQLTIMGLRDMEIEVEENCFSMVSDVFGSVIHGGGLVMNLPNMKSPCGQCPFRKDTIKGWLGSERMTEILEEHSFVCHKKTDLQCAGFMILKGNESSFVSLAKSMDLDTGLRGHELIFENKTDCINHHKSK